jgi:hypothetical protein
MAIQQINIGQAPNDGTGDLLRDAFGKANGNFSELDTRTSAAWNRANEGVSAAGEARMAAADAAEEAKAAVEAAETAQTAATAAGATAVAAQAIGTNAQADATHALEQVVLRAPVANPVFTGQVVASDIAISQTAENSRSLLFRTGTSDRWGIEAPAVAEEGGNAGSPLVIRRYDDAGANVDTPFVIDRGTGRIALGPGAGNPDASAALFVNGGIRADSWFIPGSFTQLTLPTASASLAGAIGFCSDAVDGPSDAQCTGNEWLSLKTGLPVGLAAWGSAQGGIQQGGGEWFRFPDGRMMLYATYAFSTAVAGWGTYPGTSFYYLVLGQMTFPVTFVAPGRVLQWDVYDSNNGFLHWTFPGSTLTASSLSGGVMHNMQNGINGGTCNMRATVLGRWKV